MFAWGIFGKLSVADRASGQIEQHKRDLYDAQRNVALFSKLVEYHSSEIHRLQPIIDNDYQIERLT